MRKNLSDEQLNNLKEQYGSTPNPELSKQFGVKVSWLESFATRHGLRKNPGLQWPDLPPGHRVGSIEVVEKTNKKLKNNVLYLCRCDCEAEFLVKSHNLRKELTTECVACSEKKRWGVNHHRRTGAGDISGTFWSRMRNHAHERGIPLNISVEEAFALFQKQNGKCALSGVAINFPVRFKDCKEGTASLDRIDSTKGYELHNVQWVHRDVNFMKGKLLQERFLELCKAIAANITKEV